MAITLVDVVIPPDQWVNLSAMASIPEGQAYVLQNKSRAWLLLHESASPPSMTESSGRYVSSMPDETAFAVVQKGALQIWAKSVPVDNIFTTAVVSVISEDEDISNFSSWQPNYAKSGYITIPSFAGVGNIITMEVIRNVEGVTTFLLDHTNTSGKIQCVINSSDEWDSILGYTLKVNGVSVATGDLAPPLGEVFTLELTTTTSNPVGIIGNSNAYLPENAFSGSITNISFTDVTDSSNAGSTSR